MTSTEMHAHTLRFQSLANRMARGLLHTPLLCRMIGRRLIVVEVVGRRTGRRFAVPVAYLREGEHLLVGTPFTWGRNLRTGEPVTIRYRGRRRVAQVEVIADEAGVVDCFATMARANKQFAGFNAIGRDHTGEPDANDLRRCWRDGARAFRFSLEDARA